jgi:hypothetical protein
MLQAEYCKPLFIALSEVPTCKLATILFYVALIHVRDPLVLGLACGASTAAFWPSFNMLQFRLSESRIRARTMSLFSSIIPAARSLCRFTWEGALC